MGDRSVRWHTREVEREERNASCGQRCIDIARRGGSEKPVAHVAETVDLDSVRALVKGKADRHVLGTERCMQEAAHGRRLKESFREFVIRRSLHVPVVRPQQRLGIGTARLQQSRDRGSGRRLEGNAIEALSTGLRRRAFLRAAGRALILMGDGVST